MAEVDHGARAHMEWSASASARLWGCPGSLALVAAANIEDKENPSAAWGTACHQIAETCLREGRNAFEFLGEEVKTKEHTFEFSEEMAECTQFFLDHVNGRLADYRQAQHFDGIPVEHQHDAILLVEQRFRLDTLETPFEAGGTGDAVLLFPAWGMIEIVDLKTGRKRVASEGNKQLRTYALGALSANRTAGRWRTIRSTIVQPRLSDPIRSEDIDVLDLLDWAGELLVAMRRSKAAEESLGAEGWADAHLVAGDHCEWCPVAGACPALAKGALERAQTFFGAPGIPAPPDPVTLPVDKLVTVLDAADMIEGWLNAVRARAQAMAEQGVPLPTSDGSEYILVPKQARRKWKNAEDESRVYADLIAEVGLAPDDVTVRKVMSPAQVEKVLGAKKKALIKDLWTNESSGVNLVRADKTTLAEAFFNQE